MRRYLGIVIALIVALWDSHRMLGLLGGSALILYFKAENAPRTQLATSLVGGAPHVSLSGAF